MKRLTFASFSFGCRVNYAEKQEIDRQMAKAGFVYEEKQPDIFIINTCSVTQKAEREGRQLIYQLRKKHPQAKIIITGCSATYWQKNSLYNNLPVDLLINNVAKEFLVNLLMKRFFPQPKSNQRSLSRAIYNKFLNSGRLLIKIQDGCHRFCSFCIVPYLRGQPKSRKIKEILEKINQEKRDIKETILTAINSDAYGYDTKESFIDLVTTIVEQTKIPRISFGSIHPLTINNEFLDFYKTVLPQRRLVNFFHIPLQSGSNKILSLMKRGYVKEQVMESVQSIKRLNKNTFITTDVIVGFLEETAAEFEKTYNLLKVAPIDRFHIFRFAKRKGTAAYFISKRLKEPDAQTKLKRAKILADLGKKKFQMFLQKQVGLNSSALFLNKKIKNYQEALLENQVPAYIESNKDLTGQIKNVKIISFKKGRVFGKII